MDGKAQEGENVEVVLLPPDDDIQTCVIREDRDILDQLLDGAKYAVCVDDLVRGAGESFQNVWFEDKSTQVYPPLA
jgi:hypothetical protein